MANKVFNHFTTVQNQPETKDLDVAAGMSIIIRSIDFIGSGQNSFAKLELDPEATPLVISAARGDKYALLPREGFEVVGPAKIRSTLDKTGGGNVEMGIIFYYEEL